MISDKPSAAPSSVAAKGKKKVTETRMETINSPGVAASLVRPPSLLDSRYPG